MDVADCAELATTVFFATWNQDTASTSSLATVLIPTVKDNALQRNFAPLIARVSIWMRHFPICSSNETDSPKISFSIPTFSRKLHVQLEKDAFWEPALGGC
jgi:hypothetical protein